MRIGVFTPLLSNIPLPEVLSRLRAEDIDTVELATENYPGDTHCKLSMLENKAQLEEFRRTIAAIRILRDAIFHVHAKDTQIYERNLPLTGVLDTKPYTDERNRSWIFRTCGYGHGESWRREFASTLRMYSYDDGFSIEHEDSLLSPGEGLRRAAAFLRQVVPVEKPAAAWWV